MDRILQTSFQCGDLKESLFIYLFIHLLFIFIIIHLSIYYLCIYLFIHSLISIIISQKYK